MKRNILIAAFLVVLALGVVLSFKRSSYPENSSGEIRHFKHARIDEVIRFKNGETVEEYFDRHIHAPNRPELRLSIQGISEENRSSSPEYLEGMLLTHRVQSGETLEQLAEHYRVTPYQIRKRNNLSSCDVLKEGQVLQIVPGEKPAYRIRPGDDLAKIGKLFNVEPQRIMRLNHLESEQAIWAGQKLIMPLPQQKIDTIMETADRQKQEEIQRKKRYERELLARLTRQKLARQRREAKARAREEKARKTKARKEKKARLERAQRVFKYAGSKKFKHKIRVSATAYTSHRSQTDSTPFIAAWNNRIRPGMKIIAVSPDLIRKYGITNGVRVKIAGLPGTYVVRDKMNKRLHNHIDIYMGTDRRRALRWGRRRVVMYW